MQGQRGFHKRVGSGKKGVKNEWLEQEEEETWHIIWSQFFLVEWKISWSTQKGNTTQAKAKKKKKKKAKPTRAFEMAVSFHSGFRSFPSPMCGHF